MLKQTLIATITAGFLTGCITEDDPNRRAKIGAVVGAVTGAAIGSRNDRKDAAKGAAIGGLLGVGIGAYMDKQAAELQSELGGSGVTISRDGDNIVLNMPESITFDSGKSNLKPRFQPTLNDVAKILNKYKDTSIEVAGHTDSVGDAAYNQSLSENRANSVRGYLTRTVAASRVRAIGYGESQPVASNQSSAGKAQNRRVELTISPKA